MEPLWNFGNFAYRWSYVEKMNTAVLSINKKKDMTIIDLYNKIVKKTRTLDDLIANFHPDEVSKEIAILNVLKKNSVFGYKPLKVLNQFLFDPAWLCFDGIIGRFNNISVCYFKEFTMKQFVSNENFKPNSFFAGAFTYHLHLSGSKEKIITGSYFEMFENYYKSILQLVFTK
jgi:hypothetical protein